MYVYIYIISESWLKGHDVMSAGITLTPASASSGPLRLTFRDAESKEKKPGGFAGQVGRILNLFDLNGEISIHLPAIWV